MTTTPGGDAAQLTGAQRGSRWPIGRYTYDHTHLSTHLWQSGRTHAHRALSMFGSVDTDEQQLAAISVGCAVEQMSKALIVDTNPALLTERADRDTLLHLTDHGHLASKAATEVRTLSAADAVALVTHLHPSAAWRPSAGSVVFRVRNAAAHMALVDADDLHAAVLVTLRYVDSLLPLRGANPEPFWGERLAPLAADLLDEAQSQRRRIVAAKEAAARARLHALVGRLDQAARAVVLASLSGRRVFGAAEYAQAHVCPVCGQDGVLSCTVDRGHVWDGVFDDGDPGPAVAQPVAFDCPVCQLELEGDELDEFDFPSEIELSTADSVWEPDEDRLRGR